MGKPEKSEEKRYKFETLVIAVCVAMAFGFMVGAAFTVYKLDNGTPVAGMPPNSSGVAANLNSEKMGRIAMLKKAVEKNPDDGKTWVELGNLYVDTAQNAEAIAAYTRALDINPNNANVITDLGVMYRRSGDSKKAVEMFDRAIAVDPKHETSRFNKGVVLLHDLKDEKGAMDAWRGLLEVNPLAMAPSGQSVDELIRHFESQGKK